MQQASFCQCLSPKWLRINRVIFSGPTVFGCPKNIRLFGYSANWLSDTHQKISKTMIWLHPSPPESRSDDWYDWLGLNRRIAWSCYRHSPLPWLIIVSSSNIILIIIEQHPFHIKQIMLMWFACNQWSHAGTAWMPQPKWAIGYMSILFYEHWHCLTTLQILLCQEFSLYLFVFVIKVIYKWNQECEYCDCILHKWHVSRVPHGYSMGWAQHYGLNNTAPAPTLITSMHCNCLAWISAVLMVCMRCWGDCQGLGQCRGSVAEEHSCHIVNHIEIAGSKLCKSYRQCYMGTETPSHTLMKLKKYSYHAWLHSPCSWNGSWEGQS